MICACLSLVTTKTTYITNVALYNKLSALCALRYNKNTNCCSLEKTYSLHYLLLHIFELHKFRKYTGITFFIIYNINIYIFIYIILYIILHTYIVVVFVVILLFIAITCIIIYFFYKMYIRFNMLIQFR